VIVAVDPSVRSPGAAVIDHRGILVAATAFKIDTPFSDEDRGTRARHVARVIFAWYRGCDFRPRELTAVYEWPQIYRASKSKGDPNDLVALAAVGTLVAEMINADRDLSPKPAEWIGNLPKVTKGDPWKSPRAMRIASRLSPAERARVPDSHDAIDAVGLALFAAGRLDQRRVLPGAT
jgi:hypothetical protein